MPLPGAGGPGDGVGRGDERIGAVVDVEQHALRAFEQDLACPCGRRRRGRARPAWRRAGRRAAISRSSASKRGAVDRRLAEAGAERVVVRAQAVELRADVVEAGEVADADRAAADLVLIGRADAAAGGADLARAAGVLAQRRRGRGGGAGSAGRSRRCASTSGVTAMPWPAMRSTSAFSAHGSSTTPLPMIDGVPRTMPEGSSESL